jgi:tetratricopeptide (TPR) repeat protein
MRRSIDCYEQALIEDPEFVLPYTGLSDSYLALGFYHVLNFKEAGIKSKHYALKGLELERNIGETHAAYATNILCFDWRWSEAEKEYLEAIRLSPSDAEAHHMYAHLLESTSRFDEAIKEMEKALELEPLSIILNNCMGNLLFFSGKLDESINQFHKTFEMDPDFPIQYLWLGRALLEKGALDEAIDIFEKGTRFPTMNASVLGGLGLAYAVAGRTKESHRILEQLDHLAREKTIDNSAFAYVYMGLGNKDKTLEYLEKCFEDGDIYLFYIPIDPVYKALHSDPRFKLILKKMGLG